MVVHHHEPECPAKKNWIAIFKVKVIAKAFIIKIIMTVSAISSEAVILLKPSIV